MNIIAHDWNGHSIPQTSEELSVGKFTIPVGYVNATKMCQANGKEWAGYARRKASKSYWEGLSNDMQICMSSLIITIDAFGDEQGTWVHPEVAIDLAQWVSVPFKIWANRTLTQVLSGAIASAPQPQSTGDMLVIFAQAFKEHEQRLFLIEQENAKLTQQLQGMTATVEVHDVELHGINAELDRFSNGHGHWYTVIGYAAKKGLKLSLQQAQELGRKASAMCRANNIKPQKMNDARFGNVQSYPDWVLDETF